MIGGNAVPGLLASAVSTAPTPSGLSRRSDDSSLQRSLVRKPAK